MRLKLTYWIIKSKIENRKNLIIIKTVKNYGERKNIIPLNIKAKK